MPISIPMMPRRGSSTDMASVAAAAAAGEKLAGRAATFVPPHMLHRHDSDLAGAGAGGLLGAEPSLGLSPSGGAKREKLLARNAILRSTGFIEVHHGVVPTAVIGARLPACLSSGACHVVAAPGGCRAMWLPSGWLKPQRCNAMKSKLARTSQHRDCGSQLC